MLDVSMEVTKNTFSKQAAILLLISLLNFWIWKIIGVNIVIGLTLIILSILLLNTTLSVKVGRNLVIVIVVLTLAVSFYNVKYGFDRTLFTKEPVERLLEQKRHGYLSKNLGNLFTNKLSLNYYSKLSLPLSKIQKNAFSALDPNLYFFASHPRERKGIDDFEKYSFILFPIFLIGLLKVLKEKYIVLGIYFLWAFLMTALISARYALGPVLYFPIINVVLLYGVMPIFKFVRNYEKFKF